MSRESGSIVVRRPEWVAEKESVDRRRSYRDPEAMMELILGYARENLRRRCGGPFAAALFGPRGELLTIGTNMVVGANCVTAHAPIIALMQRCADIESYDISSDSKGPLTMATLVEPCIGCAGFIVCAGIPKLIFGAPGRIKEEQLEMEQGGDAALHLEQRGVEVVRGVCSGEVKALIREASHADCPDYNPKRS